MAIPCPEWMDFKADWDVSDKVNRQRILQDRDLVADLLVLVSVDSTEITPQVRAEMRGFGKPHLPFDPIVPRNKSRPLVGLPELLDLEEFRNALRVATVN
jgi:thiol:disulfide interchange protein